MKEILKQIGIVVLVFSGAIGYVTISAIVFHLTEGTLVITIEKK